MGTIRIGRIDVGPEIVEALVSVDPAHANTSRAAGLPQRALELLPGLARHTCDNGTSHGMIAELGATETAHLLEHVAVELMALSGSPRTLRAETVWDFVADGQHVYRVRLAYDIDLVALAALREGLGIVEWLVAPGAERPDIDGIVARLREVRAAGA